MRTTVVAVVALVVGASVGAVAFAPAVAPDDRPGDTQPTDDRPVEGRTPTADASLELTTADSAEAFHAYVRESRRRTAGYHGRVTFTAQRARAEVTTTEAATAAPDTAGGDGGSSGAAGAAPERVGTTNVQVAGIDEPDVVKTDGSNFYVRALDRYYEEHDTAVVDASDPAKPDVVSRIDRSGKMLQSGERLLVIGQGHATGYDIADPENPERAWERNLDGSRVVTARLQNGTAFFVVANEVPREDCEVRPFEDVRVPCTAIEFPRRPVPAEVTYTVVSVDAATGAVEANRSLVGSRDATVYASGDGLYLTYTERAAYADVQAAFLAEQSFVPDRVTERVRTVRGYNLSARAERVEIEATIQRWFRSLPEDEAEETRERYREAFEDYLADERRNLTTTHVVRLSTDSLETTAVGQVPGRPLNQFAFDAHEGHLRVATTVGETWGTESANDVYVLDTANLSVDGEVTGMSPGQRVYGVRFVGDTGYVITFRQVDPLHVLDLSDPENPTEEGQLKLPGYSTYLHPLGDGRVLGIGEEDGRVKAVVFDVSDPTEPTVERSRVLDARYSAVARTHHAFTRDPKHGVFFLPTEEGGYVLSSEDLSTETRVDVEHPRRARYVNDYLYVFSDREVVVVNETTWERVYTLGLEG